MKTLSIGLAGALLAIAALGAGGTARAQSGDGWTKAVSASAPCPGLLARMRTAHQNTLPPGWREALTPGKREIELPCPRT